MSIDDLGGAGLEAERAALDEVVEDTDTPAVAVVSPPFGGRAALAAYVVDRIDGPVDRCRLTSHVDPESVPAIPTDHPLVLEDCQYLFRRRIDGFRPLDVFTDSLARRDVPVLTFWNRYAWEYCRATRAVAELFTEVIDVGPLETEGLQAVVTTHNGRPAIVDRGESTRAFSVDTTSLQLPASRTVEIPYPRPNRAWLALRISGDGAASIETEVFETLRRHSNGNPGVATAILDRSVQDGEIAPSEVYAPADDLQLGDDSAYLLWIVLATERIPRAELSGVLTDHRATVALERLRSRDLVSVEDDAFRPTPENLPAATAALERKGLLW